MTINVYVSVVQLSWGKHLLTSVLFSHRHLVKVTITLLMWQNSPYESKSESLVLIPVLMFHDLPVNTETVCYSELQTVMGISSTRYDERTKRSNSKTRPWVSPSHTLARFHIFCSRLSYKIDSDSSCDFSTLHLFFFSVHFSKSFWLMRVPVFFIPSTSPMDQVQVEEGWGVVGWVWEGYLGQDWGLFLFCYLTWSDTHSLVLSDFNQYWWFWEFCCPCFIQPFPQYWIFTAVRNF